MSHTGVGGRQTQWLRSYSVCTRPSNWRGRDEHHQWQHREDSSPTCSQELKRKERFCCAGNSTLRYRASVKSNRGAPSAKLGRALLPSSSGEKGNLPAKRQLRRQAVKINLSRENGNMGSVFNKRQKEGPKEKEVMENVYMREITVGKSLVYDKKTEKEKFKIFNKGDYWTRKCRNACSLQCAVCRTPCHHHVPGILGYPGLYGYKTHPE